jgi:formyl-CoA transferase/CoA:oxalate CoA-transferase
MNLTSRALAGTRVVTLVDGFSSASVCAELLASFGADLSTVDPTTTGPADVVILDQSGLAGLADHGLDPRTRWPEGTVIAQLTPYGASSGRAASDLVLQAESAVISVTGYPAAPTRVGVPISAYVGGWIGCGAVLAALHRARATGRGAVLDLAAFDAMVMMQGNFLPGYLVSGREPVRVGNVQPLSAPWNAYPTRDGQVVIAAISESLWRRLLGVIGRSELADREEFRSKVARVGRRDEVDAMITAWTRERTVAEVAAALRAADVPAGEVRTIAQLLDSTHSRERDVVRPGRRPGPAVKLSGSGGSAPARTVHKGVRRPLDGVRVLELGGHTAGGLATRMLADLGADVIKVELPQGDNARTTAPLLPDGHAYLWHFWNVGKRSVVLDFTRDNGRRALLDLVAVSDVVLENMALDTVERLGITSDDLTAANPGLVYCAVSGFGLTGGERYRRAFDAVLQAETGIMSVTGYPDEPPVKAGPSIVDNSAALAAVAGILAALVYQQSEAGPIVVDAALFDVAAAMTAPLWTLGEATRRGNRHPAHPVHDLFETVDGQLIALAAISAAQERAAREVFGLTGPCEGWGDQVRLGVAGRRAADVLNACDEAGIPAGRVNGIADLVAHPLVQQRRMLLPLGIGPADETCTTVGTPYAFEGEPPMLADWRRVPDLGQHTEEVLVGLLGYTADQLRTVAH